MRAWQRFAWWLIALSASDAVARLARRRRPDPPTRRVLLIRLDSLGDFVLWLDAARELRRLYPAPTHRVTLLCERAMAELAADAGVADEIWPVVGRRFVRSPLYRLRVLWRVRRAGFNTVIESAHSRDLLRGDAVAGASGAAERIAPRGDAANTPAPVKRLLDRRYTRLIETGDAGAMELRRNAALVRGLGGAGEARVPTAPPAAATPDGFALDRYYVIAPGAAKAYRRWPPERFAELADRLHAATGWTGVLCGTAGEAPLAHAVADATDAPLEDWTGRTSPRELSALLGRAALVLTNETGSAHLAAAHRTPTVAVAGGGHWGRFLPYDLETGAKDAPSVVTHQMPCFGCNWNCVYNVAADCPFPCIAGVEPNDVWTAVEGALARSGALDGAASRTVGSAAS